jgi:hypothetical protein
VFKRRFLITMKITKKIVAGSTFDVLCPECRAVHPEQYERMVRTGARCVTCGGKYERRSLVNAMRVAVENFPPLPTTAGNHSLVRLRFNVYPISRKRTAHAAMGVSFDWDRSAGNRSAEWGIEMLSRSMTAWETTKRAQKLEKQLGRLLRKL